VRDLEDSVEAHDQGRDGGRALEKGMLALELFLSSRRRIRRIDSIDSGPCLRGKWVVRPNDRLLYWS
jgi:hypothetical protein